jgi:hypothetical protein
MTDCKRGVGKAMAVALAEGSADIVGVSKTLGPSGSEVEKEGLSLGRDFEVYTFDLSDRAATHAFSGKSRQTVQRSISWSATQARSCERRLLNTARSMGTKSSRRT